MREMKMCDALGRAHEFFLALKKAGLSDEATADIINTKDNVLAEAMVDTYFFIVGENKFELVYEFEFDVPKIDPPKFMRQVNDIFLKNEDAFDPKVFNIYRQSSPFSGKKKALLYRNIAPVPEKMVRAFIKSRGLFPGALGLVFVWHEMVAVAKKHNFPKSRPVFAFEEKRISSATRLINFGKISDNTEPSYHLSIQSIKDKTFGINNYFLVLQDSE